MIEGFLLTREWHERGDSQDLVFWLTTASGPLEVVFEDQESIAFVAQGDEGKLSRLSGKSALCRTASLELRTFAGEPVSACYFRSQRGLNVARSAAQRAGLTLHEADLRPTDRFLMERFITGAIQLDGMPEQRGRYRTLSNPKAARGDYRPQLRVVSLDIETSVSSDTLLSVALFSPSFEAVVMLGDGQPPAGVIFADSEAEVIQTSVRLLDQYDPDVIIGWNVVGFDLRFLQNRCDALGISFALGRDARPISWRHPTTSDERNYALVPGRVVLDGIELLRNATYSFESFSLEYVAGELLGRGKLVHDVDDRAAEIEVMFRQDKAALARYNLEDCRLVWDVFQATNLLDFAIDRTVLTGLDMDRMGGSVAAFDFLYLPRLHRAGFVAPVRTEESHDASPGGIVLESRAGIFDDVLVLDFKSLYPSIVRTFHVDPLALAVAELEGEPDTIAGFKGARFSRSRYLLPTIIEELWTARDEAKRVKRSAMSQAIKIIMNSFYGVLGTTGCRFFDPRLVSSITMRGHEILEKTRDLLNDRGFEVIYGDTDSVFVLLGPGNRDPNVVGRHLAEELNAWWRDELLAKHGVTSCLEVEYETHFSRFFMPTIRGSDKGSKKRYAGVVEGEGMVFKGLESVRSDWSPLARSFQRELYALIFAGEPFADFVKMTVEAVQSGERDEQLTLRKRLRRKLDQYTKNVPPHVRAARRLEEIRHANGLPPPEAFGGGWIEYVMTVNGPEPLKFRQSPFDYQFYVERQLAPIADAILHFHNTSLAALTDRQGSLF